MVDHPTADRGAAGSKAAAAVAAINLAEFILADPIRKIRGGSEEKMSTRLFATGRFTGLVGGLETNGADAQTPNGKGNSHEQGRMEGVLGDAKQEGSTFTP